MSATLDEILDRAVYRFGPLARLCALVDGTLAQMHGGRLSRTWRWLLGPVFDDG